MIEIYESTIIYVACPAKAVTGGPELLHQMVNKLNKLGFNSKMYYYGRYEGTPVPDEYLKYKNDWVTKIIDNYQNLLIVPEVNIGILREFKNIKNVVWWLSVDNYFASLNKGLKGSVKNLLGINRAYPYKNDNIIHFVQSYYAKKFLIKEGIKLDNIYYLSDYLSDAFFKKEDDVTIENKLNLVLYNPKKGIEFTQKLINKTNGIEWIPLQNMTAYEVSDLLRKSKVYIDFGNHPGKDRFPREASISGCCVITGKNGSANFFEDVAIEDEFKFEASEESIDLIVDKINLCIKYFEHETLKFENYRSIIKNEEQKFEDDILKIFSKI